VAAGSPTCASTWPSRPLRLAVAKLGRRWREMAMSRLDQAMAWPLTAEMLVDFLHRPEWDRPNEGLHFEHKRELSAEPGQIPKAVAASANSEGGGLFLGAEAVNGVLTGFPGLPRDQEWGRGSPTSSWVTSRLFQLGGSRCSPARTIRAGTSWWCEWRNRVNRHTSWGDGSTCVHREARRKLSGIGRRWIV
jgi:hypothetical protein